MPAFMFERQPERIDLGLLHTAPQLFCGNFSSFYVEVVRPRPRKGV